MSREARNRRRALIVRRWAAYRTGRAQREIWRRRREAEAVVEDDEIVGDGLLAELPENLVD